MCYDFETGSKDSSNNQLTQISSIMIDPRKLKIIENSLFDSEVRPILDDEAAIAAGYGPVEQDALDITHKTREKLALAAEPKQVWNAWIEHTKKYYIQRGGSWGAPIRCGFNIVNFDNKIVDRFSKLYGQWDNKWNCQDAFHPLISFDLLQEFWKITENQKINSRHSISLDSIREWLGMSKDGAHDAKNDILDCAELVVRMLKLSRKFTTGFECIKCQHPFKIQFENSLANWKRPQL